MQLPLLHPSPSRRWRDALKGTALRLYRLGVILAIVWLIHRHHVRLRADGYDPIRLEETKAFFPTAERLVPDPSEKAGLWVMDRRGQAIGYALRTSPQSDKIVGYSGATDTLVALGPEMNVVGIRVRSSQDTKEHVADIVADDYFMTLWNGKGWDEIAAVDPREAGVEGVSGASLTSLAIASGIRARLAASVAAARAAAAQPRFRVAWDDVGLALVIAAALLFTFTRLRGRPWPRRIFQAVLIGYVGLINGQILAMSLFAGWSRASIPWRMAPGLALLAAAALIVPFATRRQLYCTHLCPHGAAQEWLGRIKRRKPALPRGVDRGLRWLPPLLIAMVIFVVMIDLPTVHFDLAGIEPFDAYSIKLRAATVMGLATVGVAIAGLAAAVFLPMAYCKYGCPTGALLAFVRSHGKADAFTRRDLAAGLLVAWTIGLSVWHAPLHRWLIG